MKYIGKTDEYFEVVDVQTHDCAILNTTGNGQLLLLWFISDDNHLTIDGVDYVFNRHQIVCLTEFHKFVSHQINGLKLLKFNRPFYCVVNHDSEVGCRGILYFGSANVPILQLSEQDVTVLETVWQMLCMEMVSSDNLQLEMLQMMLKRILILCTRIYKQQNSLQNANKAQVDIIRQFNFLVEQHFREKHTVAEYAKMLFKSPKTLSNVFKKVGSKTPLELLHNRKMIEARRLLHHSSTTISDIGYGLGFGDIQAFSRFFKNNQGISPSEFREKGTKGKIAN